MLALLMLLATPASADTVAYANLAGGLGFTLHNVGDFALGAEHVFGEHLGALGEATLVHVHGNPTHATTYGAQVGVRYHLAASDAPFVGLLVGYKVGGAKVFVAKHGGPYWGYDLRNISVTPHIGYRWGLGAHGAITTRAGVGWERWDVTARDTGAEAKEAEQRLMDRTGMGTLNVDLELSVGLRF